MAFDRGMRANVYVNKMRAELEKLEDAGVICAGNAFSPVLLVKGELGPAEREGNALLSGSDGKALRAALTALGYAPEEWAALATWLANGTPVSSTLLRQAIVAFDPATLVLLDEAAANAVREALANDLIALDDLEDALLTPGRVVQVAGMRVLALDGFEAALGDDHSKQVMWARLKQIPPLGEPY